MKKIVKNTTVVALSGVMAIGMLSGCGSKSIDGEKTVATVDGTDIPMGVVSLYARESQAQTVAMYKSFMGSAGNIWSQVVDEDAGTTYGEQAVGQFLEQVELMYIMKEKAADYGVEVTSDDETAIADAAAQFMQDNDEDTLKELAVSEDQVKTLLELETYRQRIYDPIRNEAEVNITDEEAQQSSFSYVSISISGDDLTDDDIATRKEQAQEILDKMKEDPTADMGETAKAVDDTYSGLTGTIFTNDSDDAVSCFCHNVVSCGSYCVCIDQTGCTPFVRSAGCKRLDTCIGKFLKNLFKLIPCSRNFASCLLEQSFVVPEAFYVQSKRKIIKIICSG